MSKISSPACRTKMIFLMTWLGTIVHNPTCFYVVIVGIDTVAVVVYNILKVFVFVERVLPPS